MTLSDDSKADMADVRRLDAGTVDRLLSGRMDPDDAPPSFAGVAELVRALVAPPGRTELAGQAAAVAAASAILSGRPRESEVRARSKPSRGRARARFLRTKVASLAFAGTLLGTTGLAAAGVLPDPVQEVAHRILSKVGIDVPSPTNDRLADQENEAHQPGGGTGQSDQSSNDGVGRDQGGGIVGPTQPESDGQSGGNGGNGGLDDADESDESDESDEGNTNDGDLTEGSEDPGNGDEDGSDGNGQDGTNENGNGNSGNGNSGNGNGHGGDTNGNGNPGGNGNSGGNDGDTSGSGDDGSGSSGDAGGNDEEPNENDASDETS